MQYQIDDQIKNFLLALSRVLDIRIEKVLDLYFYVTPETVRIVEIVERGSKIVGLRLAVRSRKKPDVWYYVAVGEYGAKCTCEGNTVGGKICRHIIIGVITWNVLSLIKHGEGIDLSKLTWLYTREKDV
ncbi:zinc finger, SWIM domain protein [Pyrobaculum islandicum DSM 4184]|uniref:Zinc finger, SWIM domain protein n=1 Tax=Pyrobaculum islandicum (strain DSM 4184 / JCM 9189 / GEO3) TaxID=384616 RepID=A1RRP4_PYRIL|nr:SWIM zinc finger family protein [Pyrobaculum islandicum]ABL87626.1 zinc finger, SWIM domain protein [Pyrobaculum islandicum DSM 4184]